MIRRVVVTGASGSVGTALLRASRPGWQVIGLARRLPGHRPPYDRAEWLSCDVGAPSAGQVLAQAFEGADAVVHLAWAIQPHADDPPMRRTNVDGSRAVLRAAASAGVPQLVCASSVAVYTPAGPRRRVTEEWPRGGVPGNAYARHKVLLERMLDEFERQFPGVAVARVRPCAVVQREAGAQLARWMVPPLLPPLVLGRGVAPFPVWPGLRAQIVHADDVADAIRTILDQRAAGAFNVAAEPVLRGIALARIVAGVPIPLPKTVLAAAAWSSWRLGLQPVHPGWLNLADQAALVSTDRARAELGWFPSRDAVTALRELVGGLRRGAGTSSAAMAVEPRAGKPRPGRMRLGRPTHQPQR